MEIDAIWYVIWVILFYTAVVQTHIFLSERKEKRKRVQATNIGRYIGRTAAEYLNDTGIRRG